MEIQKHSFTRKPGTAAMDSGAIDNRQHRRFKLAVDIRIGSRSRGLVKGQTVDISESGISAMLKLEVPVGELVQLEFTLPFGAVTTYAMVRQRNAFRYGFQFVTEAESMKEAIRATCNDLAVKETLLEKL